MTDLTTESGFEDFLVTNRPKIAALLGRVSRDAYLIEDAVSEAMHAVYIKYVDGTLIKEPAQVFRFWETCARRRLGRMTKQANRARMRGKTDDSDCCEDWRQPITSLKVAKEPTEASPEDLLIRKEDGQAAAKQLSALELFAISDEEVLVVIAVITDILHANEEKSESASITVNMSEVARQCNERLGRDRFTYKTVQTRLRKFSLLASKHLQESVA